MVCKDNFLSKSDKEAERAFRDVVEADCALAYFLGNSGIAHDRSGNQLREHRNVQQKREEIALRLDLAAINVDKIGNRLECEEAYSYRERDIGLGNAYSREIERVNDKIRVLEHADYRDIQHKSHNQRGL